MGCPKNPYGGFGFSRRSSLLSGYRLRYLGTGCPNLRHWMRRQGLLPPPPNLYQRDKARGAGLIEDYRSQTYRAGGASAPASTDRLNRLCFAVIGA